MSFVLFWRVPEGLTVLVWVKHKSEAVLQRQDIVASNEVLRTSVLPEAFGAESNMIGRPQYQVFDTNAGHWI